MTGPYSEKAAAIEGRLNALVSRLGTGSDTTSNTATGASTQPLTISWTVPANTALAATVYRIRCGGHGAWGSTQQQLSLEQRIDSTVANNLNVGATAFAASDPVEWDMTLEWMITATGAGGLCRVRLCLSMSKSSAAANNTNGVAACRRAVSVAFDTTGDRLLHLNALWASTTGAPTITCDGSTFEKISP